MKIWIEVELYSLCYDYYDIASKEELSFTEFKTYNNLWIKMSKEYYTWTIEYNFYPFDYTEWLINETKDYLNKQINRYSLFINNSSPAFVGTHIHFFDKKLMPKKKLLNWVLSFILENKEFISKQWLFRLICAHQLWAYWNIKNNRIWEKLFTELYYKPILLDTNKPKYVPIFSSKATLEWKPKSLEIRCIPNDFIFNWKLIDLLDEIETKDIFKRDFIEYEFFFNELIKELDKRD